jgi:hypothetical protein
METQGLEQFGLGHGTTPQSVSFDQRSSQVKAFDKIGAILRMKPHVWIPPAGSGTAGESVAQRLTGSVLDMTSGQRDDWNGKALLRSFI